MEPKLVDLFGFGTEPPATGKPSGDGIVEKDVNRGHIQQFGKSCAKIVGKLMKSDDRREGPEELVTPCATPGEESLCKGGTQVLADGGHDLRKIRAGEDKRKEKPGGTRGDVIIKKTRICGGPF